MYEVKAGDTFDSISRKVYGTNEKAAILKAANPGVGNPPQAGAILFTPSTEPPRVPSSAKTDLVSITINGSTFQGWERAEITRSMDTFGTFTFEAVWSPEIPEHRAAFRPFQYQDVALFDGLDLLFTGTLLDATPSIDATSSKITASGYSTPGVLNDCTVPASAMPLEGDTRTLREVAKPILDLFGLRLVMPDAGAAFDREAIAPEDKAFDYLAKLAKQRNVIITDTPDGACRIYKEAEGPPVARLAPGGYQSISPQFSPQEYYSDITGRAPTAVLGEDDDAGSVFTVVNPRLRGRARPFTFKVDDATEGTLPEATRAKLGRMHGSAVTYSMAVNSWRTPSGKLWAPGDTVEVLAPQAMIYKYYLFLVRDVKYSLDGSSKTAALTLVLPGAFSGKMPETMPWEE